MKKKRKVHSAVRVSILSLVLLIPAITVSVTAFCSLMWWLYPIAAVVFIAANIKPSFRRKVKGRLRFASDGADLLCAFLVTLPIEIAFVLTWAGVTGQWFTAGFWVSALVVWLFELITFWNGIIRVYLTCTMIGGKWRIIGLICGMIPILHIIVLLHIIRITRIEVNMEIARDERNRERTDQKVCATKYPLLLVHGVFFRDSKKFNYWGRIPAELKKNGAVIFYGNQQSALGIKKSGKEVADTIKKVIEETGAEKVNIIAHSKGGLDSRYAITTLGMDKYVASLTTINTPHRGCVFAEWLLDHAPDRLRNFVANRYNDAFRLVGDNSPDFLEAVGDLTASYCARFNEETPDRENVYYQSVGSKINSGGRNIFPLTLSYMFSRYFDGPNDGLVAMDSAKWGDSFTTISSKAPDGVSHADVIDLMRRDKPDVDIREFYVQLVSGLKDRGL